MHLAPSAFGNSSKGKANIAACPCPWAQLHLHHEIRNEVNIKNWSDINYNKHASSEQGQFFVFVGFFPAILAGKRLTFTISTASNLFRYCEAKLKGADQRSRTTGAWCITGPGHCKLILSWILFNSTIISTVCQSVLMRTYLCPYLIVLVFNWHNIKPICLIIAVILWGMATRHLSCYAVRLFDSFGLQELGSYIT